MSGETVILLSRGGPLRQALRAASGPARVIALDETAVAAAHAAGVPHEMAAALPQAPERELAAAADRLARAWYRPGGVDGTMDEGLSLGELFYFEIGSDVFVHLARRVSQVQAVASACEPRSFVLATDANEEWAGVVRAAWNGPGAVVSVPPRWSVRLARLAGREGVLRWLRRQGLDRRVRETALRWLARGRASRRLRPARRPVVFVVDIPVASVMDTLVPVIEACAAEDLLLIATDPRCLRALEARGLPAVPFRPESLGVEAPRATAAERRRLRDAARALAASSGPRDDLDFRGVPLWPIVRLPLSRLLRRRLPLAAEHHRLAREALRAYRAEVVVTASDAHYSGQIFVSSAREVGARSLTIQHGLFAHDGFGYVPVRASKTTVLGEAVRERYLELGVPAETIAVTGLPRLDLLRRPTAVAAADVRSRLGVPAGRPLWLLAPDPGAMGDWMWSCLVAVLAQRPEVFVLLRPHPNDSLGKHQQAVARSGLEGRVRVDRWPDTGSALHAADLLICAMSTMVIEAMIVDRPVVLLLAERTDGYVPYVRERCVGLAEDAAGLARAVDETTEPAHAHTLAERRRVFLDRYAAGADGRSAGRVAELIASMRLEARAQ